MQTRAAWALANDMCRFYGHDGTVASTLGICFVLAQLIVQSTAHCKPTLGSPIPLPDRDNPVDRNPSLHLNHWMPALTSTTMQCDSVLQILTIAPRTSSIIQPLFLET
ncbi:hypothetical protein MN608_00971 [Microdochium nivale]|nr:hypothetical protein MN608_00971 [Microdochium nivale]